MRKLAVSAPDAGPARSTAENPAASSVAAFLDVSSPLRPRTFDSNHENGGDKPSWDKRAC